MNRRDFVAKGLTGIVGSCMAPGVGLGRGGRISQSRDVLAAVAEERKAHPLYFDGMTFFGATEEPFRDSGLSGLVWDVSAGEMADGKFVRRLAPTLKSTAAAVKFLRTNDLGMFLATKGSQIPEARRTGRTAVFLQLQSAESLSEDVDTMDVFYELGVRVLQYTHHYDNPYSGGALVKEWKGLTGLGRKALEKMNALGIVPDISHGNEVMGLEVCRLTKKPVIVSHTGCRALVNNARCVPDQVIRAVADTGGVVGIFSMSFWLTEEPVPTVDSYVRQLEHVIKIGGIDAVGISNDYDVAGEVAAAGLGNNNAEAVKGYFPWWKEQAGILGFDKLPAHCVIPELNNIRRFFTIQDALERKGYKAFEIDKIIGGNWVRLYAESLG
jgi:membrane dipeptidase